LWGLDVVHVASFGLPGVIPRLPSGVESTAADDGEKGGFLAEMREGGVPDGD
jgi:hypothetical protein